jgi:hypothetical protein
MNSQKNRFPFLLIGILLLLTILPGSDVKADVGVPPAHPGYSLSPGDYETNVQMVSEVVEIIIREDPFKASVSASFQMRNNGVKDEEIEVWFPLGEVINWGKKDRVFQAVDFQAWVNGSEMDLTIEKSDQWKLIWAHWPVRFPAETPVEITVSYILSPSWNNSPAWCGRFDYILETGAGWQGVIETAEIIIQTPYPLGELDALLGFGDPFFANPSGYSTNHTGISWMFSDLEPTEQDNINFSLLEPETWHAIYDSYITLETSPNDWEAHERLARGLSIWKGIQAGVEFHGFSPASIDTDAIADLIRQSWIKTLELSPPDVGPYRTALWYFKSNPHVLEPYQMQNFFNQAIELFPEDEQISDLYEEALAAGLIVDGAPSISATPPLPEASETPVRPIETDTIPGSTSAASSPPLSLIMGSIFIIAAGVLMVVAVKRRKE